MNGLPLSRLDVKFWLTLLHKSCDNLTLPHRLYDITWSDVTIPTTLRHKPCDIKFCRSRFVAYGPMKWLLFISYIITWDKIAVNRFITTTIVCVFRMVWRSWRQKSAGMEDTSAELVQAGGEAMIDILTSICNKIMEDRRVADNRGLNP